MSVVWFYDCHRAAGLVLSRRCSDQREDDDCSLDRAVMIMDQAIEHLFRLLEDWRAATNSETEAIRTGDWQTLARLQGEKLQLQERIQRAEREVFGGDGLTPERRATERQRLKKMAQELKGLEIQNRDLLMQCLERIDNELRKGNRTISGLRGVHKAYGVDSGGSFWEAMS